jgi:hypothetical protein
MSPWGISSSGRASVLQTEGDRFESDILHVSTFKFNCNQGNCEICNPKYKGSCKDLSCAFCQGVRNAHDRAYSIFNLQQQQEERERQQRQYTNQVPSKYIRFDETDIGRQYFEELRAATPTTTILAGYTKKISNTQKENIANMNYNEINAINSADEQLDKELAEQLAQIKLQQKQDALASLGDEPTDTNFVAFEKKFDENGPNYEYVAIKIAGRWFTSAATASAAKFDSWNALKVWLVKGPFPTYNVTKLYPASK